MNEIAVLDADDDDDDDNRSVATWSKEHAIFDGRDSGIRISLCMDAYLHVYVALCSVLNLKRIT
jgi:hypothetical protein